MDNSRKCLICCSDLNPTRIVELESSSDFNSSIDFKLHVIFLLHKVLELPSAELEQFLQYGHPGEWALELCATCGGNIDKIWGIFVELQRNLRRFQRAAWEVREEMRNSSCTEHGGGFMRGSGGDDAVFGVADKCRRSVVARIEGPPTQNTFILADITAASQYLVKTELDVDENEIDSFEQSSGDHSDVDRKKKILEDIPVASPASPHFQEEPDSGPSEPVSDRSNPNHPRRSLRTISETLRQTHRDSSSSSDDDDSSNSDLSKISLSGLDGDGGDDDDSQLKKKVTDFRGRNNSSGPKRKKRAAPCYFKEVTCSLCRTTTGSFMLFVAHVSQHHAGYYQCLHCRQSFSIAKNCYEKHWVKAHQHLLETYPDPGDRCVRTQAELPNIPWWCPQCSAEFVDEGSRDEHLRNHKTVSEMKLKCGKCQKHFFNKHERTLHQLQSHPVRHECSRCLLVFFSEDQFRAHRIIVHQTDFYKCPEETCQREFQLKDALYKHQQMEHRTPEEMKETTCHCGKICVDKDELKKHAKTEHGHGMENICCEVCGRIQKSALALRAHMKDSHGVSMKYTCSWEGCTRTFIRSVQLKAHIAKDHEHKTMHHCNICGNDLGTLNRHFRRIHLNIRPTIPQSEYRVCLTCGRKMHRDRFKVHVLRYCASNQPTRLFCKTCKITFPSRAARLEHIQSVHPKPRKLAKPRTGTGLNLNLTRLAGYKRRTLSTKVPCGKLMYKFRLKIHQRLHQDGEVQHKCSVCCRLFASAENLEKHRNRWHSETSETGNKSDLEVMTPCYICGRVMQKRSLYLHLRHHAEKQPQCDICGAQVCNKYFLAQHMANTHGIGDFKCDVEGCTRVFEKESRLKQHVALLHEGKAKPKKECPCRICGKIFVDPSHRRRHEATIHGGDRETKPHVCSICGKSFGHKLYLQYHVKGVHQGKIKKVRKNPDKPTFPGPT